MDPFNLLSRAISSVKAVRWALGVAGLVAVVAIVQSFHLAPQHAVFGTLVVVIFMVLLLVFSAASQIPIIEIRIPAMVLIWAFLIISIASGLLLFTSTFFGWPLPLPKVIFALNAVPPPPTPSPTPTPTPSPTPEPLRLTSDSGWIDGGSSPQAYCAAQVAAYQRQYPGRTVECVDMKEDHKSEYSPFKHDMYRYQCWIVVK